MKIALIVLLIIIAVIFVLLTIAGIYFSCFMCLPNSTPEDSVNFEKEHGFFRDFDKRNITEYYLNSFDGYRLKVFFVPNPDFPDSNKYILINHGYSSSHYGALKYLNMWMKLGYHCVIWDGRHHGDNEKSFKKPCTLGYLECRDMMTVLEDTYERYGKDIYLGLQGESMGSAIQITALKFHPKAHFIVNDCGFADLPNVLEGSIQHWYHLPKWLMRPTDLYCQLLFHWSYYKNRPIDSIGDNTIPICFMHGEKDDFIVPENSKRMAAATKGYSELHMFPGAGHAESVFSDEKRYLEILTAFVEKVSELEKETQ